MNAHGTISPSLSYSARGRFVPLSSWVGQRGPDKRQAEIRDRCTLHD